MKMECCTEHTCESGLKNNFFEGKRLTPDMFRVEQQYLVERRRLLNRAIHGWGVVYGYGITSVKDGSSNRLEIKPGLALDKCGRELSQVGELPLKFDQVIIVDKDGHHLEGGDRERDFTTALPRNQHAGCSARTMPSRIVSRYRSRIRAIVSVTSGTIHARRYAIRYARLSVPNVAMTFLAS
jgi:hypothetical protein